jgi:hypothetical protein
VARPRRYRMSMICRSRRVKTMCVDVFMCYFYNRAAIHITPNPGSVNRHRDRHRNRPRLPEAGTWPGWSPAIPGGSRCQDRWPGWPSTGSGQGSPAIPGGSRCQDRWPGCPPPREALWRDLDEARRTKAGRRRIAPSSKTPDLFGRRVPANPKSPTPSPEAVRAPTSRSSPS